MAEVYQRVSGGWKSLAYGATTPVPYPAARYPLHTDIVATTFWVGEIFDPDADDGSQVISAYDGKWYDRFGGCDGDESTGVCETELRTAANNYFPTAINPKQNPFYLDLPFDDVNNAAARARRSTVIPWASDPGYIEHVNDNNWSFMKNRWVKLMFRGKTCYAQIQDAGPGEYDDAEYVFGVNDERPLNVRYGAAGMDVSPAVVGYLGFDELNGIQGGVDWQFVDDYEVPDGPWKIIITASPYDWTETSVPAAFTEDVPRHTQLRFNGTAWVAQDSELLG